MTPKVPTIAEAYITEGGELVIVTADELLEQERAAYRILRDAAKRRRRAE